MKPLPIQKKLNEVPVVARCLDPDWVYIPAAATDVRKTWAKFGWTPIESEYKEKPDKE